jgi:hypothetical protein
MLPRFDSEQLISGNWKTVAPVFNSENESKRACKTLASAERNSWLWKFGAGLDSSLGAFSAPCAFRSTARHRIIATNELRNIFVAPDGVR